MKKNSKTVVNDDKVLKWQMPYYIYIFTFVFLLINTITILNIRGVVDPEGYLYGGNKPFLINSYEDDGNHFIFQALGYNMDYNPLYIISNGGPYNKIINMLLYIGDKMGIIRKYDDPYTYYLYPKEFLKIWKFVAICKLWIFLIWMPIVLYWIGSRHFSKVTGILASLFIISIPFITWFEPKNKVDSITILFFLFSFLYQLEYLKNRKIEFLYLASVFIAISLAVCFKTLSGLGTLFLVCLIVKNRGGRIIKKVKNLLLALLIVIVVYVILNPPIIWWFLLLFKKTSEVIMVSKVHSSSIIKDTILSIWYRIIHFDSFYGEILNWLVIPSIIFASFMLFSRNKRCRSANSLVLISLVGYFIYFALIIRDGVKFNMHYYYAPAILILLLIAELLGFIWEKTSYGSRIVKFIASIIICIVIVLTMYENIYFLKYMTSKTNRQEVCRWIEKHIPLGAVVGIPMDLTHSFFNQWIRLDPFKYRLVHIGKQAELLDRNQPDYLLWILFLKDSPRINNKDYKLIAEFAKEKDLPREGYDLFQEEVFQAYKRINKSPDISNRSILGEMECEFGEEIRKDTEKEFRILQFQAISFMPLWLNLMRESNGSIDYDSHISFERSVRGIGSHDFKYSNVCDVGPAILQLWGVRYVLVKLTPDPVFIETVLKSNRYNFKEVKRYKTIFGNEEREVGLFYNNDYIGQVFFTKYGEKKQVESKEKGILYDTDELKRFNTNNIAIYIKMETTVPLNIIIKGGGNDESWDINKGNQVIWMPYRIFNYDEPVMYEINPIKNNGRTDIKKIYALTLYLYGWPFIDFVKITRESGSAKVNADSDGDVIFSLPYDRCWKAKVDGVLTPVKKGLAGTIAVEMKKGKHFVEVFYRG